MTSLTEQAHTAVRSVVRPGDIVIDATTGNGHDTLFLAECVGPRGLVYGFDLQLDALKKTLPKLEAAGIEHVRLIQGDHAEMAQLVRPEHRGGIAAVMFNLGYLPGGDKSITTQPLVTLLALRAAWKLLKPGGILTVMAYTGHPGGWEEASTVRREFSRLADAASISMPDLASIPPDAPQLYTAKKRAVTGIAEEVNETNSQPHG